MCEQDDKYLECLRLNPRRNKPSGRPGFDGRTILIWIELAGVE